MRKLCKNCKHYQMEMTYFPGGIRAGRLDLCTRNENTILFDDYVHGGTVDKINAREMRMYGSCGAEGILFERASTDAAD